MYQNPFIVAGKIPAEYFCDRQPETERIASCIGNQENIVLISPRRMGKTQLIDHCFSQLEIVDDYITLAIDILHTTTLRELIYELGTAVFRHIAHRNDRLLKRFVQTMRSLSASFGYDPVMNTPTFDIKLGDIKSPEYTLDEIFQYINEADRRCIITIDEFQQITNYPEKNVEALLRAHIQRTRNANFIFAGSQRRLMGEMFLSYARPFYQSATLIELQAIPLDEYTAFATRQFQQADKAVSAEAISWVYETFDGVTFYLQRLMHDAFAATPAGAQADTELLQQLTNRLVSESDSRLREQLAYITEQQKEVLYAICADGTAERITSADFIKRHRLRSASAVQSAVKRLLEFDIITERERRYRISDPLLQLWMRQR